MPEDDLYEMSACPLASRADDIIRFFSPQPTPPAPVRSEAVRYCRRCGHVPHVIHTGSRGAEHLTCTGCGNRYWG